jgi:hypothetical protein
MLRMCFCFASDYFRSCLSHRVKSGHSLAESESELVFIAEPLGDDSSPQGENPVKSTGQAGARLIVIRFCAIYS